MSGNKLLAQMALNKVKNRNLDTPITGSQGYLGVGEHEVKLIEVGTEQLDTKGYLDLVFQGMTGDKHKERIWVMRRGADEYSHSLILLVNALFEDTSVYKDLDEAMTMEDMQKHVFESFRGMRVCIKLERSDGYTTEVEDHKIILTDAKTGARLDDRSFDSIGEAREVATARKLKRSWCNISAYKGLSDDVLTDNRKRFYFAIEGVQAAKKSGSIDGNIFDITDVVKLRQEG